MSGAQTVLVTGATGFVGVPLVAALLARGFRVRALGRNPSVLARLATLGAEAYPADLGRDTERVVAACQGAGLVYHLGALSSPWGKRADFERVNIGGTQAIVNGCIRHGVERLVYISSPSVLFNGHDQTDLTDDVPYPARFVSLYSETKKRAEDIVNGARGRVPFVIIRPKAIFGPGDTTLLPRLLHAARQKRLPQIGNGANRVDLTYIDNVVHALLLAADAPKAVGNTYTVTNGEPALPLWEVISTVLRGVGISSDLRPVSVFAALAYAGFQEIVAQFTGREPLLTRYGVLILARTQTYDISATRRDLGYEPVVSLSNGIDRTIDAFRNYSLPALPA